MEFRKAKALEINDIMDIIRQAQEYLKEMGINQWQNNYPNRDTIQNDIEHDYSYVLVDQDKIVATVAVSFDGEKTYDHIYDGHWLSNKDFAVIHRIAVDSSYKGLGLSSEMIKNIISLCISKEIFSIRVDTHKENIPMQKLLKKNMFQYCGVIYLESGDERVAFEKILSE